MNLIYYPDPRLLKPCVECPSQSEQEKTNLAKEMWKIMDDNNGVGLAAPQVGLNIRVFVWKQGGHNMAIWNPFLSCLEGSVKSKEGCLSIPKIEVTIQRSTSSVLFGEGLKSLSVAFVGDKTTTKIWQHEINHLDGKLIIDDMSRGEAISNKEALKALLKNTHA